MTFTVGSTDYSANVLIGSYSINSEPKYKEWTSADYTVHKQKLRDRIRGSVDMFFRTPAEFSTFKSVLTAAQNSDYSYNITLSVNNTNTDATISAYIDFNLVRDVDGTRTDYFKEFTLTIEER